jgi:uncharacterized protein with HEPN domain
MRPEGKDLGRLWDIRAYSHRMQSAMGSTSEAEFLTDLNLQLIVERCLEVIGEASSSLSPDLRQSHPEVNWRKIIGLRNVIAHNYGDIDYSQIWEIATVSLPLLLQQLAPDFESIDGENETD